MKKANYYNSEEYEFKVLVINTTIYIVTVAIGFLYTFL